MNINNYECNGEIHNMNDLYLLPEIIRHIMSYCDISCIKSIGFYCKSVKFICSDAFWHEKFATDKLMIITPRNNFEQWIMEYDIVKRCKIEALGIIEIAFMKDKVSYIHFDIGVFKSHEDVNIIPDTIKQLMVLEEDEEDDEDGSTPHRLIITMLNINEYFLSYEVFDSHINRCDYYTALSTDIETEELIDILIKTFYNNKRHRLGITTYEFISIKDDWNNPLEYYTLKYNHEKGLSGINEKGFPGINKKRLTHWNNYFNSAA